MRRLFWSLALVGAAAVAGCVQPEPRVAGPVSAVAWLPGGAAGEAAGTATGTDTGTGTGTAANALAAAAAPRFVTASLATERRDGDRSMDLEEVLALASSRAIPIQLAFERAERAAAEVDIERAGLRPSLSVGSRYFRHDGRIQNTQGEILEVTNQNAFLGGELSLSLDLGESLPATRAAESRLRAADATVRDVVHQVLRGVAWRYFDLLEAHARIGIAEQSVSVAEELVGQQTARLAGGAGLEADLLRARARRQAAERERIAANSAADLASAALVELLALEPGLRLVPAEGELASIELVSETELPVLFARARDRHPALARARELVHAGEEDLVRAETGWMIPELALSALYGGFDDSFGQLSDQGIFSAALRWDLTAAQSGEQRLARSALRTTRLVESQAWNLVAHDVARAVLARTSATERIAVATLELEVAAESLALQQTRLEQGAGLLLSVLDAEVATRRAELALVEALTAYNRAQYDLLLAVGGPTL